MLSFWSVVLYLAGGHDVPHRPHEREQVRSHRPESRSAGGAEARFARDDIGSDEFVARRQVLTHARGTTATGDR